jgi:serine/threonine-protein kinase
MVMGTAMYVSPEQATGEPLDASSDIYSLGVVAYECLAGHVPFTAREPLAIAYAHKHEPVPELPPDVPAPVAELVYDMLAKTPAERPASARVVADRADMLRETLSLGGSTAGSEFPGSAATAVTRGDLPAGATGPLAGEGYDAPGPLAPRRGGRRWAMAGLTAVLCALAAVAGLYLSGHLQGQTSGDAGGNTVQHISSSAGTPLPSPPATASLSPSTVERSSTAPGPTASPKPMKSSSPTSSPRASSSASPSSSASSSASASASSSSSASASSSSSSSSPPPSS